MAVFDTNYYQPHRYYHNASHISYMCDLLNKHAYNKHITLTDEELHTLWKAICMHDVIYDPRRSDNEIKSSNYFKKHIQNEFVYDGFIDAVDILIKNTAISTYYDKGDNLTQVIRELDLYPIYHNDVYTMIKNFKLLLKEFQLYQYKDFIHGHINVYKTILEYINEWEDTNRSYIDYERFVYSYKPKIGIYAGSFNPFHDGHMSVLQQADNIFDKVIIAYPSSTEFEMYTPNDVIPFHECIQFDGLLVDYVEEVKKYADVTLVRGLRNGNDLEYEINMRSINKDLRMDVDTTYFVTDIPHISSTNVRELHRITNLSYYKPMLYHYAYVEDSN